MNSKLIICRPTLDNTHLRKYLLSFCKHHFAVKNVSAPFTNDIYVQCAFYTQSPTDTATLNSICAVDENLPFAVINTQCQAGNIKWHKTSTLLE